MVKERVNWTISPDVTNLLRKIAAESGKSQGELVEDACREKYSDPLVRAKEERRLLAMRLLDVDDRINRLEKLEQEALAARARQEAAPIKAWRTPDDYDQ